MTMRRKSRFLFSRGLTGDRGMAMVSVLMVMILLTGFATTVFVMSVQNTKSADRDRRSQTALDGADAGVTAAIEYMRQQLNSITCPETSATYTFGTSGPSWSSTDPKCVGGSVPAWSNPTSPETVTTPTGGTFKVWVSYLSKASPPAQKFGLYRVHSIGVSNATLQATRAVTTDVTAKPLNFPIGVYADDIAAVGGAAVYTEAVLTSGCVTKRSHISFNGTVDPYYGTYPAVHSATGITDSNGSCTPGNDTIKGQANNCNSSYPGDQDPFGGPVGSSACTGSVNGNNSYFDSSMLASTYGYQPRGLTNAQYAALKSAAQAEGQYYTTTSYTAPDPAVYPNAVMYFKVNPGDTVSFNNELNAYGFQYCGQRSVTIVVEGGDVQMQAQADVVGGLFVPDGTYSMRGGATVEGTVFAHSLDKFNGTSQFKLDACWLQNMPGPLLDLSTSNYRQLDR